MGPHTKGRALLLAIGLYVNILMHLIEENCKAEFHCTYALYFIQIEQT